MKRTFLVAVLTWCVLAGSLSPVMADEAKPINVFILAGQSNMAGADSNVAEPPGFQQTEADRATLFTTAPLPDGAKSAHAFAEVRVPTLEETLSLVRQRKRGLTIIALNVKDVTREGEAKLVALVEKYNLLSESFAFDQSDEMSRRLKRLNPAFRIGQNVRRQSIEARLKEGLLDCFLLTGLPTANEVSRLHAHGKQALFNFAGESSRNPQAWQRAAAAGIDGLLTDYPLECRAAWRVADRAAAAPRTRDLTCRCFCLPAHIF